MPESTPEAIVLADAAGNYYVLPRELIELTKVSPDAKGQVDAHLDKDVSGYAQIGSAYSFVGEMKLSPKSRWSSFSPNVGWPYYRPTGIATDRINPAR